MRTDSYGTSWSSFWNDVGNFFSDAWDWFVDDVVNPIGKFVSNSWNWFVEDALPVVADFVATLGGPLVSNLVNVIYYNYFADVNSTLTSSSYGTGYLTRWQRLDFVKTTTKQAKFNYNVWRYYGEYSAHMYGWFAFKSFYQGDNPTNWFGEKAKRLRDANISYGKADERWYVNLFAIICGMLGI